MCPEDIERFPAIATRLKDDTEVTVRPLSPDDGEALAEFYAGVPREDIRFYCPHSLDREHALANAAKAHSPVEVVLVLETPDREIGGYAWYRWKDETGERSGFGICIARRCQGQGAGNALMTRLLEIAQEIGPAAMGLTVQLANARAVALYRQMGFQVVREQIRGPHLFGFDPEPEYYMERRVR
jgi:ribosomal protein S18 acetylase RimI-like enzyme